MNRLQAMSIVAAYLARTLDESNEQDRLVSEAWLMLTSAPVDYQKADPGHRELHSGSSPSSTPTTTAAEFNRRYRGNPYELD